MSDLSVIENNRNISFKIFEKDNLVDCVFSERLVNGTTFNKIKLNNVNFNSSDIEYIKIIDCVLDGCSFVNTSIKSIVSINTIFSKCDFTDSTLTNSEFVNCTFDNCIFDKAIIDNSNFKGCNFDNSNVVDGEFTSNFLEKCCVSNQTLKNIHYYNIYADCNFNNCKFETYLLGFNYGFTELNMKSFVFMLDGKEIENDLSNYSNILKKMYIDRNLILNAHILGITYSNINNNRQMEKLRQLKASIKFINEAIIEDKLIKNEDIFFINTLVNYFLEKNELPNIFLLEVFNYLNQCTNCQDGLIFNKAQKSLNVIKNTIMIGYMNNIENIYTQLETPDDNERYIKVTYNEKPQISFYEVLRDYYERTNKELLPKYIGSREGSYIEEFIINGAISMVFQILATVITNYLPKSKSNKTAENISENTINCIENSNVTIKNNTSDVTLNIVNPTIVYNSQLSVPYGNQVQINYSNDLNKVMEMTNQQKISTETEFQGLNRDNIIDITMYLNKKVN